MMKVVVVMMMTKSANTNILLKHQYRFLLNFLATEYPYYSHSSLLSDNSHILKIKTFLKKIYITVRFISYIYVLAKCNSLQWVADIFRPCHCFYSFHFCCGLFAGTQLQSTSPNIPFIFSLLLSSLNLLLQRHTHYIADHWSYLCEPYRHPIIQPTHATASHAISCLC